jgi:hypothetical protein
VNGTEYAGGNLRYVDTATAEYFSWFSVGDDGSGTAHLLKVK